MEKILSKENPIIKEISKLKQAKYVKETNMVLLEGMRLISEAETRNVPLKAVFANFYLDEDFSCPTYFLGESAFKALSSTVSPQGIIAACELKPHEFSMPKGNFLVLDGVSDPGNMGTIIRTAVASGFCEIYARNCVDFRNDKVIRSTMGTIFDCKVMNISLDDFQKLTKHKMFCAEMDGESVFKVTSVPKQFGLVMGNEAHGISDEIKTFALKSLSIPMKNKVESLNVAVASGILMYILSSKQN